MNSLAKKVAILEEMYAVIKTLNHQELEQTLIFQVYQHLVNEIRDQIEIL